MKTTALLVLVASLTWALEPSDVFSKTRDCSLSSPEFTKCIKDSIQAIISNLDSKEMDEEERMDPMLMPDMPFRYSDRLGITLSDMALHGLSRTTVNAVRTNVKDLSALRLEVDVRNPLLYLEGNYSAILSGTADSEEPIASTGSFNVSIIEVRGTLLIKGHVVERDNNTYLQVDKAAFKPQISNMKLSLSDDEDPFPELTTMVVSLANSYWRVVYSEAMPFIEDAMDRIMRVYAQELTMDVPFYEIVSP